MHNALSIERSDLNNIDEPHALGDQYSSDDNPTSLIRVKIATFEKSFVFSNVLLDTGSHFSVVNYRYAQKVGLHLCNLQHGDIKNIMVADSHLVPINCKVRLQLQIGSLTLHEWAYCVPNLSHNIILGLKFMRNHGVNLLNDRGIVKIQGVKIPFVSSKDYLSLAVVNSDTVIPPKSSKAIVIKTNAAKRQIPFQIRSLPQPPTGLVVNTSPNQQNGKLCAISHNNTNYVLKLKRNTPIGYAVRFNRSEVNDASRNDSQADSVVGNSGSGVKADATAAIIQREPIIVDKLPVETNLPSNLKQAPCQACSRQLDNKFCSVQLEGSPDSSPAKTFVAETERSSVPCKEEVDAKATQDAQMYEGRISEPNFSPKRTFEELGLKLENTSLSEMEKRQFKDVVQQYNDVFALDNSELTGCVLGSLKLRPKSVDNKPFRAKIYPQSTVDRLETERQIDDLFRCGFIERSTSKFQ